MHFSGNEPKSIERLSYLLTLVLFSIGLYFMLRFFNNLPYGWGYLHILGIAVLIVITSRVLRRILS